MSDSNLTHKPDEAALSIKDDSSDRIIGRLNSVAECHADEPFGNLLRTAASRIESLTAQSNAIVQFLKDMRASGSWDTETLDRAIEVADATLGSAQ